MLWLLIATTWETSGLLILLLRKLLLLLLILLRFYWNLILRDSLSIASLNTWSWWNGASTPLLKTICWIGWIRFSLISGRTSSSKEITCINLGLVTAIRIESLLLWLNLVPNAIRLLEISFYHLIHWHGLNCSKSFRWRHDSLLLEWFSIHKLLQLAIHAWQIGVFDYLDRLFKPDSLLEYLRCINYLWPASRVHLIKKAILFGKNIWVYQVNLLFPFLFPE